MTDSPMVDFFPVPGSRVTKWKGRCECGEHWTARSKRSCFQSAVAHLEQEHAEAA